jgi:uncharacterized protein (TIGR03437 family)
MFSPRTVVNAASYRQSTGTPSYVVMTDAWRDRRFTETERLSDVTPGQIVTLFGSMLGPQSLAPAEVGINGRLKTTVAETTVLFDGVAAPIIYVWDRQAAVIVPYSIAGRKRTAIELEYRGRRSAPVAVNVADAAPGLFTADQTGAGSVLAFNQDYAQNTASEPAERGRVVMLFLTGEGLLDPPGVDGAQPAGPTLPHPRLPVSVTIGGILADVVFVGQIYAGVTQLNVSIPDSTRVGPTVPIEVRIGTVSTQPGMTIAVK